MDVIDTAISDVKLIKPLRHGDHRGYFSETYNRRMWREQGIDHDFVQDNHSKSALSGTLRGLHFQIPPFAQTKLIRVVSGAILDVAVDLRLGSPTYARHVAIELSEENGWQLLVPKGFAHGFVTLRDATEVVYKVDAYYSPDHDKGVAWNDPTLAIEWPVAPENITLSSKDRQQPRLSDLTDSFTMETA